MKTPTVERWCNQSTVTFKHECGQERSGRCDAAYQRSLPVLHHEFSLRQAGDFPCLTAAAIPIDLGIAQSHEPQR